MSMNTRALLAAAGLAAAVALAVSGCAAQSTPAVPAAAAAAATAEPTPESTISAEELAAWTARASANPGSLAPGEGEVEYEAAVAAFPLAMRAGFEFPRTDELDFYPGDDGIYERGLGTSYASFSWLCAAESDYVESADGPDREAALASLRQWAALPSDVIGMANPWDWEAAVLDSAEAGDDAALEGDLRSTCAQFPDLRR